MSLILEERNGNICFWEIKSRNMKRICWFIYLWSEAVASKLASGNEGFPTPHCGTVAKLVVYPGPDLYARDRDGKMQCCQLLTPGPVLYYWVLLEKN